MFEKYSNKCINFILKNELYNINKHNIMDKIINNISKFLNEILNENYFDKSKLQIKKINKINNSNFPLIFKFLKGEIKKKSFNDYIKLGDIDNKKIQQLINNINNTNNNFNDWYHDNIDDITKTTCLLSKNRKMSLLDIIDESVRNNNDRKPLNRMMYNNPFISMDIQFFSESNDLFYYQYFNDGIKLHVYSKNEINEKFIKNIILMCKLMSKISKREFDNNDICILLSPSKKVIYNNQSKILCSNNINSGSTLTGSYINIWRSEELLKVLCHELIHFFDIDEYLYDDDEKNVLINKIKKNFNIKGRIIPFEAYTDSCAIIIHSIFVCHRLSYSINDTYKLLSLEICHSLFQAAKILNNFGITNIKDKKEIDQGTSVFSYYIIKSALLTSLNDFLKFSGNDFKFDNRIKEFNNLIFNSFNKSKYNELIKEYLNILNSNKKNIYIFYNLRMSCVQLS
jgi:hypothetical protein